MSGEVEQYTPRTEVAAGDPTGGRLVAWAQAASAAHALAKSLCQTSFVPKAFAGNPADATAAIILGDELGLSPLSALRSLYVIGGTPAMYARTMVALVMSHGHDIWTVEESEQKVTVAGRRKGSEHEERVTWTIQRATKAGYTSNKKYVTDPIAMLYARAAGDVARRIAPDVLSGVPYSVEEIELGETPTTTIKREMAPKRTVQRAVAPTPPEPAFEETPIVETAGEPDDAEPVSGGGGITTAQHAKIAAGLRDLGIIEAAAARAYCTRAIGREVKSRKDLSHDEASDVITCIEYDLTHPDGPDDLDGAA